MQETTIKINVLKSDFDEEVDASTLENITFAENAKVLYVITQIDVSGKYRRAYTFATQIQSINEDCILIDGDLLLIILFSELVVIDLKHDKLIKSIDFDCYQLLNICKFKSGYIIRGEGETRFLTKDFEQVWEEGAIDILVNPYAEADFEIFEDYFTVLDWCGYKHFYNETGEFKRKYYPRYSGNINRPN